MIFIRTHPPGGGQGDSKSHPTQCPSDCPRGLGGGSRPPPPGGSPPVEKLQNPHFRGSPGVGLGVPTPGTPLARTATPPRQKLGVQVFLKNATPTRMISGGVGRDQRRWRRIRPRSAAARTPSAALCRRQARCHVGGGSSPLEPIQRHIFIEEQERHDLPQTPPHPLRYMTPK